MVDRLTDSIHGDLIGGPIKATCTYGGTAVTLPRSLSDRRELHLHVPRERRRDRDRHRHCLGHRRRREPGHRRRRSARDRRGHAGAPAAPAGAAAAEPSRRAAPSGPALPPQVGPGNRVPRRRGPGSFVYQIRGSSTGPAPNATLRDVAPRGVRFTQIIDQPAPGVCSISRAGKLLTCSGSLVAGQSYGSGSAPQ